LNCPGSVKLSEGLEDKGSAFADEGTAAHWAAEQILLGAHTADTVVGLKADNGVKVTADMVSFVMRYVNGVRDLVASTGGALLVEQKLPIGLFTGETHEDGQPAKGTADAVVIAGAELIVCDLKFGRGVEVSAEENPQLMLYALAARHVYDVVSGPFDRIRLVISQPRLGAWSEWATTSDALDSFATEVSVGASLCDAPDAPLVPTEKGCKFCKAKATCPALSKAALDQFDSLPTPLADAPADALATAMSKAKLIEDWIKAVRAEAERRLLSGEDVPGFKLVQGRAGSRKWLDAVEAEARLKSMGVRQDDLYHKELVSPTDVERLHKEGKLTEKRWQKLQPMIVRSEGSPSVAPLSDKRPALVVAAPTDEFDSLI